MKAKTSIERMRSYIFKNINHPHFVPMNVMLDDIETQYMWHPVDADGVPICFGDRMHYEKYDQTFTVNAIVYSNGLVYVKDAVNGNTWKPDECRHVKPDTIEGLLEELFSVANLPSEEEKRHREEIVADYAERIRNVVDGTKDTMYTSCDVVTNPLEDESGFRSHLWVEEDEYNRLKEERDELRAEVMNLGEKLDRFRRDDKDYKAVAVKACNLKVSLT